MSQAQVFSLRKKPVGEPVDSNAQAIARTFMVCVDEAMFAGWKIRGVPAIELIAKYVLTDPISGRFHKIQVLAKALMRTYVCRGLGKNSDRIIPVTDYHRALDVLLNTSFPYRTYFPYQVANMDVEISTADTFMLTIKETLQYEYKFRSFDHLIEQMRNHPERFEEVRHILLLTASFAAHYEPMIK